MDRAETIKRIKTALQKRSGKTWSVTGGRGTAWGWLKIDALPARKLYDWQGNLLPEGQRAFGHMSLAERQELATLLGLDNPIRTQGVSIPASNDYWQEFLDRAEGRTPTKLGEQYWD